MFKAVSYKRRFQALLGALIIAPFLVYWIAIADTLEAASECSRLSAQYQQKGELDSLILELRDRVRETGEALGMLDGDTQVFQSELLASVSHFCKDNGLELVDFSESEFYAESGLGIETIPLSIDGGFEPTVRLIHHLETEAKIGRLISAEFKLTKVGKSRKEVLRTTLHIQNVSRES